MYSSLNRKKIYCHNTGPPDQACRHRNPLTQFWGLVMTFEHRSQPPPYSFPKHLSHSRSHDWALRVQALRGTAVQCLPHHLGAVLLQALRQNYAEPTDVLLHNQGEPQGSGPNIRRVLRLWPRTEWVGRLFYHVCRLIFHIVDTGRHSGYTSI